MYTEKQLKTLRANKNVAKCSSKSITYSKDFKVKAVKAWLEQGQSPNTIFLEAGFDLGVIGIHKPKSRLKEWRKTYKTKGQVGLMQENRGKNGGRRPKDKQSSDVEYLQAKIDYLEAENNFLRNLKTKNKT